MKKRYLISALGLATALMLSGCGGDKKETEASTSAPEKQTEQAAADTQAASEADTASDTTETEAAGGSDET